MSVAEILAIILIAVIVLVLFVTYMLHGHKLSKKEKKDKKTEVKVMEEKKLEPEQKPVPVGIIKEEKIVKTENEFAPFKKTEVTEEKKENKTKEQSVGEEIKSLSPEMKKVLMSDLLKPRF